MRRILPLTFFVLACGSLWAAEATVVSYESRDLADNEKQAGTMYFADDRLKIVSAATERGPQPEMIYRGDRKLVWIVDHGRKNYIQMDEETMERMARQFSGVYAQLEKQLAQLPPDQRAQAERMLKGRLPQPPEQEQPRGELTNTGERREINGYPCVKYEFHLNGVKDSELWVTRSSSLNFSAMAELLRSMGEFYSGLTRSLPQGSQSVDFDFQALSGLDGFPILIRNYDGDRATNETQIRQIREESVAGDFFEPPSGYEKVDAMGGAGR